MKNLIVVFLKIFFRNRRAMFFVLLLPSVMFLVAAYLGLGEVIRFDLHGLAYTDFLMAGIIAFALMQTGIYTAAYNLVDLRRARVLKQLFITPLTPGIFLSAQSLARFLIALIQVVVLLGLGIIMFGAKPSFHLLLLPVIIFIGNTLFLQFGFVISMIARDYEEAAPYTSVVGLTLTFLGDVFFPIQNLPEVLTKIAHYLPLQPLSSMLRFSILGITPTNPIREVAVVILWLAAMIILARFLFIRKALR